LRGEPAEQAQGERNTRLRGKHRVARREHEAQQVVAHVIVERRIEARGRIREQRVDFAADLGFLPLVELAMTDAVDGAIAGRGHEPGPGVLRDAAVGPLFHCGDEGVLRELFSLAHVAHHARELCNEAGGLDAPDRFDGLVEIGGRHASD